MTMPKRKPPKGKVNILLCIKKETLDLLTEMARKLNQSRNKTISDLIEEYIEEAKK